MDITLYEYWHLFKEKKTNKAPYEYVCAQCSMWKALTTNYNLESLWEKHFRDITKSTQLNL